MWTNRQFWKDATWRAFRTFCQTLAGILAAYFSGFLSVVQGGNLVQDVPSTFKMWLVFLYASAVSGLISLLQSIDRERAVGEAAIATTTTAATVVRVPANTTTTYSSPLIVNDPAAANYQP